MLLSIRLLNWRSHADTKIIFSPGANVFLGSMGSGKSSVVDALCFALYGTYPKLGRRDASIEDVCNFRHAGQKVQVELEWDDSDGVEAGAGPNALASGARQYKVLRDLSESQAWLYSDGKLIQKGARAVTEEVEKTLQIPYELFSRAVYAEQNRLDFWLSMPAGARKAELDRLLGLDKFETARKAAGEAIHSLQQQAAALEAAAPQSQIDEAKKQIGELEASTQSREKELSALVSKQGELSASLSSSNAQYAQAEKLKLRQQSLEQARQKSLGSIKTLEQMLAAKPASKSGELEAQREECAKSVQSLEASLKQAQERRASLSQSIGRLDLQIKNEKLKASKSAALKEKLASILNGQEPSALKEELSNLQNTLSIHISQQAGLQTQIQDEKKVLQALEVGKSSPNPSHPASCPVCSQPLDEKTHGHLRSSHESSLKQLEQKLQSAQAQVASCRKQLDALCLRDAEAMRLAIQLSALAPEADLAPLELELSQSKSKLLEISNQSNSLSEQLKQEQEKAHSISQALSKLAEARKWQAQLGAEKAALAQVQSELEKISLSDEDWLKIKSKRESLMQENARLGGQLKAAKELVASQKLAFQQSLASLGLLEQKRAQALQMRKETDGIGAFRAVLLTTQAQMRARTLEEINLALNRLWPMLYPYGDWSSVRLSGDEKDYSIQIFQGEWKALDAHASGGERACLALAVRAALSILLTPHLGWLILDEPTHNLDAQAVQSLGRALSERIPQVIGQVLVITHEQQLLESTPARVFRFARDKKAGQDSLVECDA